MRTYAGDMARRPVHVAVVDDYEIVVAGITAVLAPYDDRVRVVALDSTGLDVPSHPDLDIVLVDTFNRPHDDDLDLDRLTFGGTAKVVVFSWDLRPDRISRALGRGVAGYIAKSLSAEEIVVALERVHTGHAIVASPGDVLGDTADLTGSPSGFSRREAQVVTLIAQGLSNQEIADRLFLSINSVKTYIRAAYRKIGVSRRAQAVGWALANGFGPARK
jgi:DNA-binding NarL/FixJ family response regulator